MASDKPTSDPFLAAIEAKIAAWTAVRDTYLAAVSLDGAASEQTVTVALRAGTSSSRGQSVHGQVLPVGVFRDKSLKEAIPIYLASMRRKQTNKQIAQGLHDGGFPTTAENFEATVATALYRLKNEGVLLRFPDGWDLAGSYPDSLRNRLEKDAAPSGMRIKMRKRKRVPSGASGEHGETPKRKVIKLPRRDGGKQIIVVPSDEREGVG